MADLSTDGAAPDEYQLRRTVDKLRRQVYAAPDPGSSPAALQALIEAEAALDRLEAERRERQTDPSPGVLLDISRRERRGGTLMGGQTTGIDAKVLLRMSHVPLGIAHLLDAQETPLVSFRVSNQGSDPIRVRLTSFVEYYSAQAITTVEISPGHTAEVHHLPTFFPERIRPIEELTRATLQIQIDDLDGPTEEQSTFPIWLLARTTAYNSIYDPATKAWLDLTKYYGAWITPNAPAMMHILRRAAGLHPRRQMAGYQVDESDVAEQVRAVFDALKAEDIVYVNSVLAFGGSGEERTQRVRLPRESLERRSANCIDGAVLMASVLEAASLNPGLVLVPGHAFVAWEQWDCTGVWDYLETTMIGSHDFDQACESGRQLAQHYEALAAQSGNPRHFRLLPVPELRSRHRITPME